jgi:hypothetical protein
MMPIMVKEADLNRIEVPEDYEVLDATALLSSIELGGNPSSFLIRFTSCILAIQPCLCYLEDARSA